MIYVRGTWVSSVVRMPLRGVQGVRARLWPAARVSFVSSVCIGKRDVWPHGRVCRPVTGRASLRYTRQREVDEMRRASGHRSRRWTAGSGKRARGGQECGSLSLFGRVSCFVCVRVRVDPGRLAILPASDPPPRRQALCTQLVARSPVSSPALVRLCLAERSLALLVLPPQLSHVAL